MANRLVLRDTKDYSWGKVNARIFWVGGGQDGVWVNEDGIGEFKGEGNISYIAVAGETLYAIPSKVNGSTTTVAKSDKSH